MKLYKKIVITGELHLLTGLHIGDSKENVEIGGVDSPVVRRKDNNEPYIPGSSLKGKIRSLLEIALGENADSKFDKYHSSSGKDLESLFGSKNAPSRILIRDCSMNSDSSESLRKSEYTDVPYTEVKFENVINRVSGKAEHPRQIERVPAGAYFDINIVINVVEKSEKSADELTKRYMNILKSGIELLEKDYLGGSGSRGYGRVEFKNLKRTDINIDQELNFNYVEVDHL